MVDVHGINAPTAGELIHGGCSFAFNYTVDNWYCHPGYTPYTVYVLQDAPADSSLNATGGFDTYLAVLGRYLISNFPGGRSSFYLVNTCAIEHLATYAELPDMAPGPPPPALTMPSLDPSLGGSTLYLAIVQTNSCPVSCWGHR